MANTFRLTVNQRNTTITATPPINEVLKGTKKTALTKMNMLGMGTSMMRKATKAAGGMSLEELFDSAREQGVKFVACTLSMDILGFKPEELIDGIEFEGVAAYLAEADEANVNLFI